jgi:formylglycine-generating enzyme required for sulfatase activity
MKRTRQRLWVFVIQVSMCICISVSWAAEGKIGLDLEWRPIKGVQEPGAPSQKPGAPQTPDGKTWTEPVTGMSFVWVKGGCYQMGCGSWTDNCWSDEKPLHEVCVDGFWIGEHEVTQGQWQEIMGSNPSKFKKGDSYPVEQVSWNDAQAFIRALKAKNSGRGEFRLPTEAEWEYACRSGGKLEKHAGGGDVDRVAWYESNSGGSTHPVGTKARNGLGIYDMNGNVLEWCADWKGSYSSGSEKNPTGPSTGSNRVIRGGCWFRDAGYVRCGGRNSGLPDSRYGLGFRVVRTP